MRKLTVVLAAIVTAIALGGWAWDDSTSSASSSISTLSVQS